MYKKKIFYILIVSLFLVSCENKEDGKLLGQIIGSVTGAYLGSKVGSGVGKSLSTVLGTTIGLVIGGKIGTILSESEKKDYGKVIKDSLDENPDNVPSKWKSEENNVNAEVIPTKSYKINEETCRDFKKIVKKGNKTFEEESTACRDEQGNWKVI